MAKEIEPRAPEPEVVVHQTGYPIEEFSANAEALFSVRPEVLAGAFDGTEATKLTIAEAKELIETFMKGKVR